MLEELLKELEQSERLNNNILQSLKNLFKRQNELIIQNLTETQRLNQKIEQQQEILFKQEQQIEKLTTSLEVLINILNEELND